MNTLLVHGLKIDYMHGSVSIIIIAFHEKHRIKKESI